jgi:alpha-mannosidase
MSGQFSYLTKKSKKIMLLFFWGILSFNVSAFEVETFNFKSNIFLKDWLICGPFPNPMGQGIDTDFLFEHGGETKIIPSSSLQHSSLSDPSGKISWRKIKTDDSGKLDFREQLQPNQENIAYAFAVIKCDRETFALLKTGSNDRLKVWLNGKLVLFNSQPRASGPDDDFIPVSLQKGENLLLAKVDQIGGGWWLYARFEELNTVGNRLFFTDPLVSSVPKGTSPTAITDIFSVLAHNPTKNPVGPVFFEVLSGEGRKSSRTVCDMIKPGETAWLLAGSEVDLSGAGKEIIADLKVSDGDASKVIHVKTDRPSLPQYPDLQVYIVPHSHADLSWPATPEVSTNLNVQAISESINILKDLPEFKFSEEDVFVLEEFLRRYPHRFEEVRILLHKNILECGGFYFGPSELLLGGEGLVRNIYFGKLWLLNTFGINTEMAWNVDEPGHTLQMPQILSKAGIKNFIIWKVLLSPENNLNVTGYVGPNIFRWQSPDGSDVLVTSCPRDYSAGQILRTDAFLTAAKKFKDFVQRETGHNNEWDLPPVIMMADGSDCSIPDPRVGQNAKLWNNLFGYPEVKIGSVDEYFKAVESAVTKGRGKIQTMSGELPCWWAGTQSVENDAFMLTRHAETLVTAAEKFSAVNDLLFPDYEYPKFAIDNVWKGKLWVHEHNWGGTDGDISDAVKLARARETFRLADDLKSNTLGKLVSNIYCKNNGIPLIVFNSLAWQRSDIVDYVVSVKEQGNSEMHLLDGSGKEVPSQIKILETYTDGSISRAQVIFAADVPSFGYATYYLTPGSNRTQTQLSASPSNLENLYFRISIDAQTGGISSIFDKLNNREILNTSKYQGNELIALENLGVDEGEEFTDNWWRMSEKPVSVNLLESGPVRATVQIKGKILNSARTQEISLYATLPKIDLKTIMDWNGQKEIQVNATFPFEIENPRLTYEVPFGEVEYGKESPSAKASHPTVRATNNWMDLSNDKMGITFATEVTPFDVKDRLDPRFHDARTIKGELEESNFSMSFGGDYVRFKRIALEDPLLLKTDFVIQPILLRSVFSCGDPDLYFTQEGEHIYRFAIRTHEGTLVSNEATRFGWELNTPFMVFRGQSRTAGLPDSQTFLEVSAPNVLVSILKKAEDGKGVILRCYETDGKDTDVTIAFFKSLKSAEHTNIIEQEGEEMKFQKSRLNFHIGHQAIETYRLRFEE